MAQPVRLIVCDFYMSAPRAEFDPTHSEFRGAAITQVPVLRIFGSTLTGAKACVHVHGVFPYLYVPFEGNDNPNQLQYLIANALDKALNISFGQATSSTRHVYKIVLVSGIPYYGYHEKEYQFFKIYLFNPNLLKRCAELLLNGSIMGRVFQPHEAHLPFTLQFMIDYNLQGMHLVHFARMDYRTSSQNAANTAIDAPACLSNCELEADVICEDILNRHDNYNSQGVVNPGLAALWEDEHRRRQNQGRNTQTTPLSTQSRFPSGPSDFENIHRRRLFDRLNEEEEVCSSSTSTSLLSYPAEAPDGLINASFVDQHSSRLSDTSIFLSQSTILDTQDEELLNLLDDMQSTQIDENLNEDLEDIQEILIDDCDDENDIRESLEMSQPYIPTKQLHLISDDDDDDNHSVQDLFSSTETLNNFLQLDGNDDEQQVQKTKRKRLGTRSSGNSTTRASGSRHANEGWLMQEMNNVLEMPEQDLEQLQQDIVNALPDIPYISEEEEPIQPDSTTTAQQDSGPSSVSNMTAQSFVSNVEPHNSVSNTEPHSSVSNMKTRSSVRSRASKNLGFVRNRKRVNVELSLPDNFSVEQETIEVCGQKRKLNISFEMNKKNEAIDKIRPCFVRLERLQLPFRAITPPLEDNSNVEDQELHQESEGEMEHLVLESSEDEGTNCHSETQNSDKCGPSQVENSPCSNFRERRRKKRLNLSLPSPQSPRELKEKRKECREAMKQFKGMSTGEIKMQMMNEQLKNDLRHPPKGPDKTFCEDESANSSFINSFYNMTVHPSEEFIIEPLLACPVELELAKFDLQPLKFQAPFFSDPKDGAAPLSSAPCHLPAFSSQWYQAEPLEYKSTKSKMVFLEPLLPPPKADEIFMGDVKCSQRKEAEVENLQHVRAVVEENHLKVMHLEVVAVSRGKLLPDPEHDPVCCILFLVHEDRDDLGSMGVIAVKESGFSAASLLSPEYKEKCKTVEIVCDETEAFLRLTNLVHLHNPDILMGYEIEMDSWGYLVQRASRIGLNLANVLSRVPKSENHEVGQQSSQNAIVEYSELKIPGRIVLNLWRLLRHEISLQNYSLESVSFHLLHRRLPQHSKTQILTWWADQRRCFLVTDYQLSKLAACHQLLESLDLLGRTSELARLFGIQFYEVFSRGSQFRVESMMLRLAKPKNFVAVSPSVMQRAAMKSAEHIPLVMEPASAFYEDPVAVLDFQSLYPSVIIAHNLCFSTCLGRVELLGKEEPFEFGASLLKVNPKKLKKIDYYVSPNGVAFVPKSVRQGILPLMLAEILETRLMVKQSLKHNKKDQVLAKVLHARQLGLKLIANVTYGYTAANFSGRMPCIEVGDSVVAKGREILERAIRMVDENQDKWGGKVVYGDTDSMFVLFKGKSRQEAFEMAEQIANAVTLDNPSPIKLKMEKVYQPCILQTKKRYVGFMYESKSQAEPVYEAKGIETVRRDGCPAVSKLLEKCLRILFSTKDLSQVKEHTVNFFQQVLLGKVSLQDFIFAKEFRGFAGYRPGACVPALELARQWVRVDRRAEPRRSQRVPYVIVSGAPGLALIRLVRCPTQLLEDASLRLNADYYLTRALIPPLNRCFSLLGVNVLSWLEGMSKRTVVGPAGKGSISHFFGSSECPVCRSLTRKCLCNDCKKHPEVTAFKLSEMVRVKERARQKMESICSSCCGRQYDLQCDSLACPVMYQRKQDLLDDNLPKLRLCLQELSF